MPLQYSCLENPMDRRTWWVAVHGVARSQTWLSDFPFAFHFHTLEKEMASHSNVLAWRIPGTGEPDGLPSMGSHRVRHDWSDLAAAVLRLENCWLQEFNPHSILNMHLLYSALISFESENVSRSVLSDSFQPYGLQPARLLCPWNSPDKNTGVMPFSRFNSITNHP